VGKLAVASCQKQLARRRNYSLWRAAATAREARRSARYGELQKQLARRGSLLAVASDELRCDQNSVTFKNSTILMVLSLLLIPEIILYIF